jgi:hypothetical protein
MELFYFMLVKSLLVKNTDYVYLKCMAHNLKVSRHRHVFNISIPNNNLCMMCSWSRDSSFDKAMGWTAWVRFPAVQDFSVLYSVQTDCGTNPASYPMGTGGGKAAEA